MRVDNVKMDLLLARQCMSLRDLREAVSAQTITRVRRGEDVKPKTLGRIAQVLGCDPAELVEEVKEG